MRLPSRELSECDEDNVSVFADNLTKVLNNQKKTDNEVVNIIRLRELMSELDDKPTWDEFMTAVVELTNDKAPGLNNVPPNDFNQMEEDSLLHHFNFIVEFWEDRMDYVEWHEGQVVPVTKIGELSNRNKWIGVNLMDIGAKVFSSMMCKRLFKIINSHGVKYQFGSSPGVGCQDGLFTLKTALHTRHNQNLPTFVSFVDLVKALTRWITS